MKINSLFLAVIFLFSTVSWAQNAGGVAPAKVKVAKVTRGKISPQATFVGTVKYPEVADVAAEVSGKVEAVKFEEGQRVKKNTTLVTLNSDLLQKTLESAVASHRQSAAELERARIELGRTQALFEKASVAKQLYDDARFSVKGLEQRSASLKAEVERLKEELDRKAVRAPFDGIILEKRVDRGEWVSPGDPVASIARDDEVDVIVDVPERVVRALSPGAAVPLEAGGLETMGTVITVIPKGNVSTRTFPVKIRVKNTISLIEGMEARVRLPSGDSVEAFLVPRDAVIRLFGQTVVFTVVESRAQMVPVEVAAYDGMLTGVKSEGLREGMLAVVAGNERLQQGQPVDAGM